MNRTAAVARVSLRMRPGVCVVLVLAAGAVPPRADSRGYSEIAGLPGGGSRSASSPLHQLPDLECDSGGPSRESVTNWVWRSSFDERNLEPEIVAVAGVPTGVRLREHNGEPLVMLFKLETPPQQA